MAELPPAAVEAAAKELVEVGQEEVFVNDVARALSAALGAVPVLGLDEKDLTVLLAALKPADGPLRSPPYDWPDVEEAIAKLRAALAAIRSSEGSG